MSSLAKQSSSETFSLRAGSLVWTGSHNRKLARRMGRGKVSSLSSLCRFSVPKQVSLLAGYETFGVNMAVQQVGAIFWAQTKHSMACSRSHWLASTSTWGNHLKKYLMRLLFMTLLYASPKSISCWQVMYIREESLCLLPLHVVGSKPALTTEVISVQSYMSKRFE